MPQGLSGFFIFIPTYGNGSQAESGSRYYRAWAGEGWRDLSALESIYSFPGVNGWAWWDGTV
jgi:hypothetical protein